MMRQSFKVIYGGLLFSSLLVGSIGCAKRETVETESKTPVTAVARGLAKDQKAPQEASGPFLSGSGASIAKDHYADFKSLEKRTRKKPLTVDDLRSLKQDYEKIVSQSPRFVEAWINLGLVNERLGDRQAAETIYQKSYDLAKNFPPACTRLANILGEKGKAKDALSVLSPCLRSEKPEMFKDHANFAEGYVVQAKLKWQLGKKEETLKDLQEAVYHNPEETGALILRGDIHRVQQEFQQAKRLYEQVLRDNSLQNPAPVLNSLALCNWDLKDYSGALSAWERAKKADSNFSPPFQHLGQIALRNGDYPAAEKSFRRLLEMTGKDPDGFVQLGVAMRLQNNLKGAEGEYRKALDLDSKHPSALYNLALLHHKALNSPDEAIRFYERYRSAVSSESLSKDFPALYSDAQKKREEKIQAAQPKPAQKEAPKPQQDQKEPKESKEPKVEKNAKSKKK